MRSLGLNLGRLLKLDAGEDGVELFSLRLRDLNFEWAGLARAVATSKSSSTPWRA